MALKRSFNIYDSKARTCLNCGYTLESDRLKDNTLITCTHCGQEMTVDRYNNAQVVLTVKERPELRHRTVFAGMTQEAIMLDYAKIKKENENLKEQLTEAKTKADEWEKAADGLARMVEEMKMKDNDEQ